jgi:hypothetical protein
MMDAMTDSTTDGPDATPPPTTPAAPPSATRPNPDLYDSPRAVRARAKGLPGPYIEGGDDPDIRTAVAEERRLWRMLVIMVLSIVGAGFVIGTILALAGASS